MSGNLINKARYSHTLQKVYDEYSMSETSSSADERLSFPFEPTPSGNLKVIPQQVVYESKQLSIVAANPRRTKVNIKNEDTHKDMNVTEKTLFGKMDMYTPRTPYMNPRMVRHLEAEGDGDDTSSEHMEKQIQMMEHSGGPTAQLPHEINLSKMGFNQDFSIDWSKIELPTKTDLLMAIYKRVTNHTNPDVLVKIGKTEFRCHMLVLQCYSEFFADKSASRIEISEQKVTENAFNCIYTWMLHRGTDSCTLLRRDNILEIFIAAQFLQVKELEEQCWAFIDSEDLFSEDKAFMLYLDARNMGNVEVMELMVPRIQRFFLTLVSSKDFLELSMMELAVFLDSNYICIHCEMEVFMAAVRWLMYDWERRQACVDQVMKSVRFGLIAPWQLVDIRRNPVNKEFLLVTSNPGVCAMVEDGLAYAIVKYWDANEQNAEQVQKIKVLNLKEPDARNWAGPGKAKDQKNYTSYQEFLRDLSKYRQVHLEKISRQGNGDRKISRTALEDQSRLPVDMIY